MGPEALPAHSSAPGRRDSRAAAVALAARGGGDREPGHPLRRSVLLGARGGAGGGTVRPAARASAGGDGGGGHGGRWVEQEGSDGDGGRRRVGVEVWGLISPLSLSPLARSGRARNVYWAYFWAHM